MNLRCDESFVQDEGWYAARDRYEDFLRCHQGLRVLYLELGVGGNTPVIIKYPFWRLTAQNPNAFYVCVNLGEAAAPAGAGSPQPLHRRGHRCGAGPAAGLKPPPLCRPKTRSKTRQ